MFCKVWYGSGWVGRNFVVLAGVDEEAVTGEVAPLPAAEPAFDFGPPPAFFLLFAEEEDEAAAVPRPQLLLALVLVLLLAGAAVPLLQVEFESAILCARRVAANRSVLIPMRCDSREDEVRSQSPNTFLKS